MRPRVLSTVVLTAWCAVLASVPALATTETADGERSGVTPPVTRAGYEMPATDMAAAIDIAPADLVAASWAGTPAGFYSARAEYASFPRAGESYLVLSTGDASRVMGGIPEEPLSTVLGNRLSADRNDLTQVTVELAPPAGARCVAFDFLFVSEEYPKYVGSRYNDVFTAEIGSSFFTMNGNQVVAPNNVAYDQDGNLIFVNTVLGLTDAPVGTRMNGATEALVAVAPVQPDLDTGTVTLILSVQDIGDSDLDSAVLVDDLRWLRGENCARTVAALTDTDGDGLPDVWETVGIDYDGDGVPEVDLPAMGADPDRADVFVQIDWMERPRTCTLIGLLGCKDARSFAPDQDAIDDVIEAFANAPYENPDGSTGITLHVSLGGEVTWHEGVLTERDGGHDWTLFEELKQQHLDPLLRDTTHWALYADRAAKGSGISGIARGIPGADFMVTSGPWANGFGRAMERGTLMHELGHDLGLMHGGPDHSLYQHDPVYRSVMNYAYQFIGVDSLGTPDYSRWDPYVDWDHLVFNGGSIGDLGERVPVTFVPGPLDEAEFDELMPRVQGEGLMVLEMPEVMGSTGTQRLVVRVSNRADLPTTFDIEVVSPEGTVIGTAQTTVAGRAEHLVTVEVDPSTLALGEQDLGFLLHSRTLGDQTSQVTGTVTVFDPARDTEIVAALRAALEEIESDPALRQEVAQESIDVLRGLLFADALPAPGQVTEPPQVSAPPTEAAGPGQDTTSAPTATDTDPDPGLSATGAAVAAAALLAVLAAAIGITLVLRARRTRTVADGPGEHD